MYGMGMCACLFCVGWKCVRGRYVCVVWSESVCGVSMCVLCGVGACAGWYECVCVLCGVEVCAG